VLNIFYSPTSFYSLDRNMISNKILICNACFCRLRYVQEARSLDLFCLVYTLYKTKGINLKYLAYIAVVTYTPTQGLILCMSLICEEGDKNTKATSMPQVIFYYAAEISINITVFVIESLSIPCRKARTVVESCYTAVVLDTIKLLC